MSKFKVGNPWKTGKKTGKRNTERRGIWATDRKPLKLTDNGVLLQNEMMEGVGS